jgi:adenylyl-sulfate kinase
VAKKPAVTVWITGLPASGKTRVAERLAGVLTERGVVTEVIDSGYLRNTPVGDRLGWTRDDRDQNVRRLGFVARLLARNGVVPVVAAISPYRATREEIRRELGAFVEVWVSTPRPACIDHDRTGTWARALKGEVRHFTGVDDPYEPPEHPEVAVDLSALDVGQAVSRVVDALTSAGWIPPVRHGSAASEDREFLDHHLREVGHRE